MVSTDRTAIREALEETYRANHALLAGLEMRDLPDQFLHLGARRLCVDPGEAGLIQLALQGFPVDHGCILGCVQDMAPPL